MSLLGFCTTDSMMIVIDTGILLWPPDVDFARIQVNMWSLSLLVQSNEKMGLNGLNSNFDEKLIVSIMDSWNEISRFYLCHVRIATSIETPR